MRKLTIITLANGANFAVDSDADTTAEMCATGKLGSDPFVRFTAKGDPLHLSKGALDAIVAIFPEMTPSESEKVAVVKGADAQHYARRRT